MVIKKEYLKEVIKRLKKEIQQDLKGIEYIIGEGVYIQYDNIFKLIKIRDPENKYYIYRNEFNYNNIDLLPQHLEKIDFYIN